MSVDDLRKSYSRGIPLGREAKLSEVASVIAFLVRGAEAICLLDSGRLTVCCYKKSASRERLIT